MENILTKQQKEIIKRGYKKRLIVVSSLVISSAIWVSAIIFVPAYIITSFKQKEIVEKNKINNQMLSNQKEILTLPGEINQKTEAIISHKNAIPASSRIQEIISNESEGIILDEITFGKADGREKNKNKISISGTAKDRETLISFQEKIKAVDFVENLSMPVASLAKTKDLNFSIAVILK